MWRREISYPHWDINPKPSSPQKVSAALNKLSGLLQFALQRTEITLIRSNVPELEPKTPSLKYAEILHATDK
jgi:hypothetical protein